jgi:hypothetical protein
MARPRKPSDPNQWPIPCGRCGEHHQIVANWPDGGVCGYCYQQAKRTRGICVCGHEGVLPGRIDGQPACRRCLGVKLNLDCKTCGAEDELYRGSRCWSCELAALVDQLFTNPDTGVVAAELVQVAAALKSMKRSNSGVTWIRQRHVTAFLKDLAVAPSITHEKLDELPGADRTRNYVRGLLVEHGALPRRDELTVRYAQWATSALARVSGDDHRDVVRRFIRWHLQRRTNRMETVPHGTFLRSKQTVTVTIEFLKRLNDHGITLAELQQEHLDAWLADGPSTRRFVDRFIPWAIKCRLVDAELSIARHRRGTSPKLPKSEQDAARRACGPHRRAHRARPGGRDPGHRLRSAHRRRHPPDLERRHRHRRRRHRKTREDRVRTPLPFGRAHAPTRCRARQRPHRVPPEQQLGVPRLLPR